MDLGRRSRRMFSSGVVLAVALASGAREAPAQEKKTTQTTAATNQKPVQPKAPTKPPPPPRPCNRPDCGGYRPRPPKPPDKRPREPHIYAPPPGAHLTKLPNGRTEYYDTKSGRTVTTNERGEVQKIEAPLGLAGGRMTIDRGLHGGREIITTRPGGVRVVGYGEHRGFVERPLRPGYISRTYVVGERSYVHVYREYRYRDIVYYHYVPAVYYGPAFYGWAFRPWGSVTYVWGGGLVTPWFGFYAGYFTPYPVYSSPDLWLTDYLLTENLRLAYQNKQDRNGEQAPPPGQPTAANAATLDEIKPLIAEEVRQQLAAERAAAAQPTSSNPQQLAPGAEQLPPALNQKFFVVSSNLEVTTTGQPCALTPGDVIHRTGKDVSTDGSVAVEVVSSKPGDCAAESPTTVELAALQEMHNQLREQIDSGLKMLAENKAKGLPSPPVALSRPVAEGTADQDSSATELLDSQQQQASTLEGKVRQGGY